MLSERNQILTKTYFTFITLIGIPMGITFFSQSSEAGNEFLLGLSPVRFAIGITFFILVFISGWLAFSFWTSKFNEHKKIVHWFETILSNNTYLYIFLTILYGGVLFLGSLLSLTLFPVAEGLEFFIGILLRIKILLAWLLVSAGLLLGIITYFSKITQRNEDLFSPLRAVLWAWIFFYAYCMVLLYYRKATYLLTLRRFEDIIFWWCIFLGIWALLYTYLPKNKYKTLIDRVFFLLGIFLTVLVFYTHIASWLGWIHRGEYERWNVLAAQFLQGKLYVPLPSTEHLTHDLTFYRGNWYIPNPPLPAILLMPLALFIPANNIHMGDISIIFSAFNAVLIFLILEQLHIRKWADISTSKALWFTILFAFGTNHLWVGINGGVWFFSQIVTVTFLGISIYAALKGLTPWIIGLCIGLAITSRPNSLMTWPLVFAIFMQFYNDNRGKFDFRNALNWSIKSAVPIGIAIAGLLFYNYIRFDNLFDFGYTTINGADEIVNNAQTYGLFSTKYLAHNLHIMFLNLPTINWDSSWLIVPDRRGISIFLSTPMLIYLIRKYEIKWWIVGAWVAIFFNTIMLVTYHNTGSAQFGYRYILDMIIPIMMLLPLGFPKELPWHFFVLLFFSIVSNIYGTAWFIIAE